jgi:hypothetical protein
VIEGDSLSGTSNPVEYPAFLTLDPSVWQVSNVAIGGTNTAQMLARATNVDNLYNSGFSRNIAIIGGGTNDAAAGISPAQSWANLAAWSAGRRAKGFKTIVTTLFCIGNGGINALIYANWQGVFDGLADPASNPNLGPIGSCTNETYFLSDHLHPNPFSAQTIIAPINQAAIVALQ